MLSLGLLPLFERMMGRRPSKQRTLALHKKTQQLIALGHWEQALSELQPLLRHTHKNLNTHLLYLQILNNSQQHQTALLHLKAALQEYPNDLHLLKERGRLYLELRQPQDALVALQKAEPILRSEDEWLDLATAYFLTDHVAAAWEILKDRVLESRHGRLLALAGDCQFQWKNYPLAVDFYEQAQHHGWINQRTRTRMGHALHAIGKLTEAERIFREVLGSDSGDVTATLGLGGCFETRKLYRRALLIYQSGQAWDQGHALILRQAGICCVHTGQFEYAETYLQQSIKTGATPQALAFLGVAYEKQQKWSQAEETYLQLAEEYPEHPAGHRALAWLFGVGLSEQLSAETGLQAAHQALQLMPDSIGWELLSACEARAGNFTRAHSIQEQLSTQAPDRPTRLRRRAAMRSLRKKIPLTEQLVSRVLVA